MRAGSLMESPLPTSLRRNVAIHFKFRSRRLMLGPPGIRKNMSACLIICLIIFCGLSHNIWVSSLQCPVWEVPGVIFSTCFLVAPPLAGWTAAFSVSAAPCKGTTQSSYPAISAADLPARLCCRLAARDWVASHLSGHRHCAIVSYRVGHF